MEQRQPTPELLMGDPFVMQSYLGVQRTRRRYRSLVLSFHEADIDAAAFNSGSPKERGQAYAALSFALETAFPGIPPANRPPILASTHTHLRRLEINVIIPRFVHRDDGKIRSYNPNPPKSSAGRIWGLAQDLLNKEFDWRDPNNADLNPEPVGPGWLERKHRSAMRSGVTEFRENAQLFILERVKNLANRLGPSSVLNFALNLVPVLMDVGYRLGPLQEGRLTVKSRSGSAKTVFKGGMLGGRSRAGNPDETVPKRSAYEGLWRSMAATNAGLYRISSARHDVPQIGHRLHGDPYMLPSRHLNWKSVEERGAPKETTVAAMLATAVSRVARKLQQNRSAILAAKSLNLLHRQVALLTQKIEDIPYVRPRNKRQPAEHSNDRVDQASYSGPR